MVLEFLKIPQDWLDGERLDERSDIFSFGVLFSEMLEGTLPYPFNSPELKSTEQWNNRLNSFYGSMDLSVFAADHHLSSPWRRIQTEFENIVLGCLLPYRRNRWPSFTALRQEFEFHFPNLTQAKRPEKENPSLHQKALALYKLGELSKALQMFNHALKVNPNHAQLWLDAAVALVDAKMFSTAKEFVARAKQLNPNIEIHDSKLQDLGS